MLFTMIAVWSSSSPPARAGSLACRSPAMMRSALARSPTSRRCARRPTSTPASRLSSIAGINPSAKARSRSPAPPARPRRLRATTRMRPSRSRLPATRCGSPFASSGRVSVWTVSFNGRFSGIASILPTMNRRSASNSPTEVITRGRCCMRERIMNGSRSGGRSDSSSNCSSTERSTVRIIPALASQNTAPNSRMLPQAEQSRGCNAPAEAGPAGDLRQAHAGGTPRRGCCRSAVARPARPACGAAGPCARQPGWSSA